MTGDGFRYSPEGRAHLVKGERGAWERGDPMGVAPGVGRGVAPGVLNSFLRTSAKCLPLLCSGTSPCATNTILSEPMQPMSQCNNREARKRD